MSTNCLVTKLKGEVNNSNLDVLGFIPIVAKATGADAFFEVDVNWNETIEVKSDTVFNVYSCNATTGVNIETVATSVNYFQYTYNTVSTPYSFKISIPNDNNEHIYHIGSKYGKIICSIKRTAKNGSSFNCAITVNTMNLKYLEKLVCLSANLEGNLDDIPNIKEHTTLISISRSPVYGDAANIIGDNLTSINCGYCTNLDLNFDTLDKGKSMSIFNTGGSTKVKGDVLNWANKMVAAGKTSGTVTVSGFGTQATVGDIGWNASTGQRTIKFGSSMVDPTTEDTNRGYQVV